MAIPQTYKARTLSAVLGTSNSTIYTVPEVYKTDVVSICLTNMVAASRTFSLDWYQSSTSTWHTIAETIELNGNSLLQIENLLYLEKGDSIRALASVGSSVSISIRVHEYYSIAQI
jgi:hypothetical protein